MTKEQKTIKLLIELDEDYYHKIMTIKPVHYTARVYISIQNGTPLNECKAEDCISREQALKNIVAWSDEEIIRNLPSVTPKSDKPSGKWIPVTERLPEPYTFVNATCRSLVDDREDWVIETIYLPIPKEVNKLGYSDWGNIPMLNWGEAEVIAWVERIIPQPYKTEIEE